jgi:hypothetical protein
VCRGSEEANKPSSVTRRTGGGSFLWDRRCRRPRAAYPGLVAERAAPRPCSALLRVGFAMPRLSPGARCALTAPFHPCLCPKAIGGLFSVALSVASQPPAVSRHPCPVELGLSSTPARGRRDPHSPPTTRVFKKVPRRGLEPPRRLRHQILSLACLPVSAPGRVRFRQRAFRGQVLPRGLEPPRACAH